MRPEKLNVIFGDGKEQRTRKNSGKKDTQLMSSPFSNFEGTDVLFLYTKESCTLNTVNV